MALSAQADDNPLSFGKRYAVLNLDWMPLLIDAVKDTPKGQEFITNCTRWNEAVHQMCPRPLTIFSALAFNRAQCEVQCNTPFARLIAPFSAPENGLSEVRIDPRFRVDGEDVVIRKTRWSATMGNSLEQILKAQDIDTVVIVCDVATPLRGGCLTLCRLDQLTGYQSGLTLSGVVMSTIYRLFDLDYNIFVIRDNVVEVPVDQTGEISRVMLEAVVPKMHSKAISLEEALQALEQS